MAGHGMIPLVNQLPQVLNLSGHIQRSIVDPMVLRLAEVQAVTLGEVQMFPTAGGGLGALLAELTVVKAQAAVLASRR